MKKNVRRVLAALLGVMMILTLSMTAIMAEEAAEENPKVSIPVTIRLTGDYPRNERYTIVLKADDAAYPMPEGSVNGRYEMTITSCTTASVCIPIRYGRSREPIRTGTMTTRSTM